MSRTTTIRVSIETHEKLKQLAEQSGESLTTILDEAIEARRREQFLREANDAYAALRADPEKWAEEVEERKLWDATLNDGLEEE